MASLQIRQVDPLLIEQLKRIARIQRRTLGQQVLYVLEGFVQQELGTQTGMAGIARGLEAFWQGSERPGEQALAVSRAGDSRSERIQAILDDNGDGCT